MINRFLFSLFIAVLCCFHTAASDRYTADNYDVEHTSIVDDEVYENTWQLCYNKDRYGDDDRTKPMLATADKNGSVVFIISPTAGIFLVFNDMKYVPTNYDNYTLYIKTRFLGEQVIELEQLEKTLFRIPSYDDNHTMMSILNSGEFKMALEMTDMLVDSRTLNASVKDETKGAWKTCEKYFENVPGFYDVWGGEMY